MNAKLIALIAAAVLSAPLATSARAGDYDRHDHGYRHDHDHRHRERVYTVRFHIDGSVRRHADCYSEARRLERYLESLGAEAHLDGDHEVHYHMHGECRRSFYSHERAHDFARSLRGLGFHVRIVH